MNFFCYFFMLFFLGLCSFACSEQRNSSGNVNSRRTDVAVQSPEVSWDLWSSRAARQQEHFFPAA